MPQQVARPGYGEPYGEADGVRTDGVFCSPMAAGLSHKRRRR
jgi:hypothetical protein